MSRLMVLALAVAYLLPLNTSVAQSDEATLTVANWTFDVKAAVKAPSFTDIIHLGNLDDGRDWLVVTMIATNTSTEEQEIHSDDIRLRSHGEFIKQTGDESEAIADELGYMSIGGSFPHDIEAGRVFDVVQVYKVAPDATDFTLVFDFNGEWEVPLQALVASSGSDARPLVIDGSAFQETAPTESPWTIETSSYRLTLIGATVAPTFSGPFHLGGTGDGHEWLVVTYQITNISVDDTEVGADSHQLLSGGEETKQSTDETRSVSAELEVEMLTFELESGMMAEIVQVFKVPAAAKDYTLQISARGKLFLNLTPVISLSMGDGYAVVPGSAIDLDLAIAEVDEVTSAPTVVPTAEPMATETSAPAETPISTEIVAPTEAASTAGTSDQPFDTSEEAIVIPLNESEESGVSGEAILSDGGDGTTIIEILVDGAVGEHPTFVQTGTCVERGNLISTLTDVDASGSSLTEIPVPFAELADGQIGPSIVAIYSTWPNAEILLACGEVLSEDEGASSNGSEQALDAAESAYVLEIVTQTQTMSESLTRFADLSQAGNMFSQEWIIAAAVELTIWNQTYEDALALSPPPIFAGVHATYVEALSHYAAAGDEFAYGVDNLDPAALNRAATKIQTANALIAEASAALDELED